MSTQHNNGWVALTTRKPTKEDGDENGNIIQFCESVNGKRWTTYSSWRDLIYCTHWQPLPPPPESEEQKRARLDEEAMQAAWRPENIGGDTGRYANFCKGFRAGLAHARQPEARP